LLPAQIVSISRLSIQRQILGSFLTSHHLDLGNTMAVSQNDTDLRGSRTLSGKFADVVDHGLGGALEPGRHGSRVWDGRGADTLSIAVKTTHGGGLSVSVVEKYVVVEIAVGGGGLRLVIADAKPECVPRLADEKSWRGAGKFCGLARLVSVSENNTNHLQFSSRKASLPSVSVLLLDPGLLRTN
jgi:hypothetical protein